MSCLVGMRQLSSRLHVRVSLLCAPVASSMAGAMFYKQSASREAWHMVSWCRADENQMAVAAVPGWWACFTGTAALCPWQSPYGPTSVCTLVHCSMIVFQQSSANTWLMWKLEKLLPQ